MHTSDAEIAPHPPACLCPACPLPLTDGCRVGCRCDLCLADCPTCGGDGWVTVSDADDDDDAGLYAREVRCLECGGEGRR